MVSSVLDLLFPKVCEACSNILEANEVLLCTVCRHQLPVTNCHFEGSELVKKVLYGRVQLEQATALFYFSKKSIVQHLLHNLKYKGHKGISGFLGQWLGAELATLSDYASIDVVIPVPLYKTKQRFRGYNQVTGFAEAIALALGAAYNDTILVKVKSTKTKVFKGRLKRYSDSGSIFKITDIHALKNSHILLVDDIITTGATIEACAAVLNTITNIKLSLATMAIAN